MLTIIYISVKIQNPDAASRQLSFLPKTVKANRGEDMPEQLGFNYLAQGHCGNEAEASCPCLFALTQFSLTKQTFFFFKALQNFKLTQLQRKKMLRILK